MSASGALPAEGARVDPASSLALLDCKSKIPSAARQPASETGSLWVLIFVCSTAALLRLAVAGYFVFHYGAARIYRGFESCSIAASIAGGHGFSSPYGIQSGPTAWLPPVYPAMVAAVFKVFGIYSLLSLWCLIALNVLFATLTTALIYRIGVRCFGTMAGFAAAVLWALDLASIAFAVRIWESSLSALLVMLALLLHLRLSESPARKRAWILYGLFWGLAGLTSTTLLTLMPFSVAALLYHRGREFRRQALIALAVFAAVLLPWSIRNYVVFHKVIPVRGNFGPELWYGNHPGVTGPADESRGPTHNSQELQAYLAMGDARYCASRQQMALDFIGHDPSQFARLTGARIVNFWTASETYGPVWRTCLSLLAFAGLFLMWRNGVAGVAVFASALFLFPLPYYVTHSEGFYRHPIEPLLGLLVAYAGVELLSLPGKNRANRHLSPASQDLPGRGAPIGLS